MRIPKPPAPSITYNERAAIERCLEIVRGCQLPDGAFRQVNMGDVYNAPVWIPPYFANYAALALLTAHKRWPNYRDLDRVRRWLEWCAAFQQPEGFWIDYGGTVSTYRQNPLSVDAWDSSAAMYLLVLSKFLRAGGSVSRPMIYAAFRAMACLDATTDRFDGMTWAKPTYRIKFLEDNIETLAGLLSAFFFFTDIRLPYQANVARVQADRIASKLPSFWRPGDGVFAYALDEVGNFYDGVVTRPDGSKDRSGFVAYPHVQAQLFALSFVCPQPQAWANIASFLPDTIPYAAIGSERWVPASAMVDPYSLIEWRRRLVEDVATFDRQSVYIYRPAWAALCLLENAGWMPGIVNPYR